MQHFNLFGVLLGRFIVRFNQDCFRQNTRQKPNEKPKFWILMKRMYLCHRFIGVVVLMIKSERYIGVSAKKKSEGKLSASWWGWYRMSVKGMSYSKFIILIGWSLYWGGAFWSMPKRTVRFSATWWMAVSPFWNKASTARTQQRMIK